MKNTFIRMTLAERYCIAASITRNKHKPFSQIELMPNDHLTSCLNDCQKHNNLFIFDCESLKSSYLIRLLVMYSKGFCGEKFFLETMILNSRHIVFLSTLDMTKPRPPLPKAQRRTFWWEICNGQLHQRSHYYQQNTSSPLSLFLFSIANYLNSIESFWALNVKHFQSSPENNKIRFGNTLNFSIVTGAVENNKIHRRSLSEILRSSRFISYMSLSMV